MTPLDQYILDSSSPEPAVLTELQRQTTLRVVNPRMSSGHLQGRLLAMLVSIVKPQRVLELGTFTGYATISMAESLCEGAKIYTIEIDDELEDIAAEFFEKAGVVDKVVQCIGDATEVIGSLDEVFDMVFIDADKRQYIEYYNQLFELGRVKSGSLILADNTLWDGKVVEEISPKDKQTRGIVDFNKMVALDPRVEKVMLPLRDGLTLIKVK